MELNILISTIDDGIAKVPNILLPIRNDVKYIVSHQFQDKKFLKIPKELDRKDVLISQIEGKGLTKSRNNAIRLATGDICVIADDDVTYKNEYFDEIITTYKENIMDVACFKICKKEGEKDYKKYPETEIRVYSLNDRSPSSIEITFRREAINFKKVLFDERFGMGSWLNGGGESLFIHDCIQSGLIVWFFPKYIVNHPHDTTIVGFGKYHSRRIRVGAAMDKRLHGHMALVKILPRTIKKIPDLIRNKKNPFTYLWQSLEGVLYMYRNKNRNS